jgi:hypothetical protein
MARVNYWSEDNEWGFEVSLNLVRSEQRLILRILTDMRKFAGVGLFPDFYGVFQSRWRTHKEAELRVSSYVFGFWSLCAITRRLWRKPQNC